MQRRCIIHSSLFIKHMLLFTPFTKRTLLPVNRVTSMSSRACLKKHAFDTIIMEDTKMIKAGIIGATGMDPEATLIKNMQEFIRTFLSW